MKSLFTFVFIGLIFPILSAQDKTYSYGKKGYNQSLPKVAIVPFDDKLFLSDINKEIGNRTGLTLEEIETTFREGMMQTIINLAADSYNFIDPTEMEAEELYRFIGAFYSCISYDYIQVIPIEEKDQSKAKKLVENFESKENSTQKNRGAYLENGEIKEWYDHKERFMDARVHNQEKFTQIVQENDLDYVLCINELDIKVMRDPNRDVGQIWPRRVKIHFTIFDKQGNKTFGSAVYNTYNGNQKDIYEIIRKNFRLPCAQIVSKLGENQEPNQSKVNRPVLKKKHTKTTNSSDEDF